MSQEQEYDVVIDTLQKQINILWKMTKSNMDNDMMNIMDDIRLKQIDDLERAIELWQNYINEWKQNDRTTITAERSTTG